MSGACACHGTLLQSVFFGEPYLIRTEDAIPIFSTKRGMLVFMSESLMILVAGPYRSGTNDDPGLIKANVNAMTDTALKLFRLGHLPVLGEWFALPSIEHGGCRQIGDKIFNEIFHPISRELVVRCDTCLRIGGPSKGADDMVSLARSNGKKVFLKFEEVPPGRERKGFPSRQPPLGP
jgi:hypothetical protein